MYNSERNCLDGHMQPVLPNSDAVLFFIIHTYRFIYDFVTRQCLSKKYEWNTERVRNDYFVNTEGHAYINC